MTLEQNRNKISRVEGDNALIVPIRSLGVRSALSWWMQRFSFRKRPIFWVSFLIVAGVMFYLSPKLFLAPILFTCMLFFILGGKINSRPEWFDKASTTIGSEHELFGPVANLMTVSPVQYAAIAVLVLTLLVALWWLFGRAMLLSVSSEGLRLGRRLWKPRFGRLIPWQSISLISLVNKKTLLGADDPRMEIHFHGTHKQSIPLRHVLKTNQRDKLLLRLQAHAQTDSLDTAVCELLSGVNTQSSYTELWLHSLNLPNKRERLAPLVAGTWLYDKTYVVDQLLALGGQGTTYLARAVNASPGSQNNDRVLKEFVFPIGIDRDINLAAVEKFTTDAALLKGLTHPGIVELLDCFVEDHRGYLVMERIGGESLRALVLRRGPMPESEVVPLIGQMLQILTYLHNQSPAVVHRDFTPDNLLLRQDGVLKLVDFNVAQVSRDGVTGTMVGKPSYVAPEQVAGESTPACDIYSLGATIFFLLTGQEPEPITKSSPRAVRSEISLELDDFVGRCTEQEPDRRPTTLEAMDSFSDD